MLDKPTIAILNNNDRLLCVTDDYYDGMLHTFLQGTAAFFKCSVLQKAEIAKHFTVGNKISFVSNGKAYHFDITQMSKNEQTLTIQADSLTLELRNEFASEYKATKGMTFKQYLDVFLFSGDNPIELGINEVSDKSLQAEWTGDGESILARLFSLANKFDAEIEFETVLNKHWGLDKVRLNVYRAHSDKYQGIGRNRTDVILEYGNNVETIEYEENIDDLKTAIRPEGDEGLTILGLEKTEVDEYGNTEYFTFSESGWIYAPQARDRFPSNLMGANTNDRYIGVHWSFATKDKNVLYGQALAELKKLCEPNVTVTIKGYEELNIGDTVLVQNTGYVPTLNLSARISEQEIYFDEPSRNASTFTNVEILQSQVDQSLIDRVNALIEETRPYTVNLLTDNGVNFKNSEGSTTLSAVVYSGTKEITPDVTVRWYKNDVWVKTAYSLTVNASDIIDKAVYRAEVMDTNGVIRAKAEVTVFNVDDGRGIKGEPVLSYASSGSINTVPTTWQSTIPAVPAGSYLWTREVTTYSDDTTSEVITPVLQGPKGDPGNDGIAGKDGIGIKSTQIMYAQSTSGTTAPTTGWSAQVPTLIKGQYLWTQTTWLYTDNTGESGYTVNYNAKDGNTGSDGIAGKDGVGIADTIITYAPSTSGTTAPASGYTPSVPTVAEGSFLWTKTVWVYTDGTNETGYSVAKQGAKGADGKDGKSITDSKQEWAASTSGTTAPTAWQTTIPTVTAGQYLWSRITETWSDNNKTYKFTIGKIGENGQNAQIMFLSATTNQMMFNADNTPKTAQSSVVTAKYQNVTGTVAFTAKGIKTDGTSETLTLTGSGDSRTITSAMFKTNWVMITVTATLAGLTDTLSIIKVNDGAQGIGGPKGYFHSAWAMSADGKTGFSTTDSTGKWYIGTYFDYVEADSTDPARYNWLELAGAVNMYFAYAWSADGTDRFTRVKPNENLWSISNSILGKFQNWSDGLSLYDNPARFTSEFLPIKEGEEYWISSNYSGYSFSVFLYKDTNSNAVLRLNDSNKNGASWVTVSSNGGGISSGGFKIPSGYYYMRLSANGTNSDIATPDLIISRKVKLEKSDKPTIYTTNPKDDYDNAVPRYIGRSLKDSTNPADFKWDPNPERKPWTSYKQGVNGEGFSLMPYGENLLQNTVFPNANSWTGATSSSDGTLTMSKTTTTASRAMMQTYLTRYDISVLYNAQVEIYIESTNGSLKNSGSSWFLRSYDSSGNALNSFDYILDELEEKKWIKLERINNSLHSKTDKTKGLFFAVAMGNNFIGTVKIRHPKLEPANTMNITTPWIPAQSEDPLGAIPKYVGTAALPYEDWTKYTWDLNPAWLQQESNNNLANKVDNDTYNNDQSNVWQEISNRVTEEEAQAIQKSLDRITGAYTDFVSTGGKHDQDLANLKSAINTDIQKLADKVLGYDFVNTWFRIGDGGLSIGEANSNFEILISNDQITFYDSGTAVAYVSNQSFFINSGMIVDDLQIGKFKFAKVNDNLMGLFHIA